MTQPFVPELWTKRLLEALHENFVFTRPRLIDDQTLEALIQNAKDIEPLADLYAALIELNWRRRLMEISDKATVAIQSKKGHT